MSRGGVWMLVFLLLAVVASGVGVVHAKFVSRDLFADLQSLRSERGRVETRWVRLQLEQGSLVTNSKLELDARKRLGMRLPQAGEVIVLKR
jgi:cell division protein FtsL